MSSTDSTIDGNSLNEVTATMAIVKEASAAGDTDVTWLIAGEMGDPYGAIVTPDVVRAARLYWEQISHEMRLGLPRL